MKKILIASIAAGALTASIAAPASGGLVEPIGLVYAPHDCTTPKQEPKRIVLACGDSNAYLGKMQWSEWGGEKAKGEGWFYMNDCDPNCADGHFISYGVKAKLFKIKEKTCGGQLVDLYRKAKLRFIGEVPPHAGNLIEWKLFCNE
jgi:hypothetical protein